MPAVPPLPTAACQPTLETWASTDMASAPRGSPVEASDRTRRSASRGSPLPVVPATSPPATAPIQPILETWAEYESETGAAASDRAGSAWAPLACEASGWEASACAGWAASPGAAGAA